jgi:predicted unusual protein kinase regulating ubiquinone biosynthesis (AarF/ABC1/UbiB family)
MSEFPSGKLERGKILAKTGLKVGKNYARYYAKRSLNGDGDSAARSKLNRQNAAEVFKDFSRLRGTALKLAQSLSMDTGVLPEEFIEVMSEAQYRVPPMNRALVRAQIRRELGKTPEVLFKSFDDAAIAAASIGQVHLAAGHDGQKLAVKLQYPNVRETIRSDLAMARVLFRPLFKGEDIDVYFTEIRDKLLEETDYGQEGQYIETFAQLYGDDERVLMPQWLPDLSSERVLTMSYIDGLHMNEFLAAQPGQERVDHFGQLLWDFIHDQVERRIYTFHADIHPGNFLFRTDGRLGILDYGCVKEFPRDFLDTCVRMLAAHIIDDEEVIRSCYYEIGILERGKERQKYQRELYAFLREFGRFVLKPYKGDAFDFGDGDFRRELNEYIRASMQWRDIRVSKHFIFVNRLLFGLYAMLMQLKPRISTRRSREILLAAADRS